MLEIDESPCLQREDSRRSNVTDRQPSATTGPESSNIQVNLESQEAALASGTSLAAAAAALVDSSGSPQPPHAAFDSSTSHQQNPSLPADTSATTTADAAVAGQPLSICPEDVNQVNHLRGQFRFVDDAQRLFRPLLEAIGVNVKVIPRLWAGWVARHT